MEKFLKPATLSLDPNSSTAAKDYKHWVKTFENFIEECSGTTPPTTPNKLRLLVNLVSPRIYEYIEDCTTYNAAKAELDKVFKRSTNIIFARHLLATRKQRPEESIDEFIRELHSLSRDCDFKDVNASTYKEEMVRDSFINGLTSSFIRQRLLESTELSLQTAYERARTLDLAQRNSNAYSNSTPPNVVAAAVSDQRDEEDCLLELPSVSAAVKSQNSSKKCYFCGQKFHERQFCPAREQNCNNCQIKGHYAKVCQSKKKFNSTAALIYKPRLLAIKTGKCDSLSRASIPVRLKDDNFTALLDSCSTDSFISTEIVNSLDLKICENHKEISLASSAKTSSPGYVIEDITLSRTEYKSVKLLVLPGLCCDILLGQDFQEQHENIVINYGGKKPNLIISNESACSLAVAHVPEPDLFPNISPDCKPVATKSRRFSSVDRDFIDDQVRSLLSEGVIENSRSPWRAQVVVAKDPNKIHKKRMCIDYSQTINLFTDLDAYPLPRIEELVNNLAKHKVFSTFDLRSAYHQIPIKDADRKFTAFEANGRLYQFCRIPFGVTNGVAAFQRIMDSIVDDAGLQGVFPYLDNITVGGRTQAEHDKNVAGLLKILEEKNLTLNESKTVGSVQSINILGYNVSNGLIKPDPERLRPLLEFPPPTNIASQRRIIGMFAYYAKWIARFSDKIKPLIGNKTFPISGEGLQAFEDLKAELVQASLMTVDESLPFTVESDASDVAVSAVLNQNGRPVAFFSRTLSGSELQYPAVEKEATALIEAVRKWRHFLARGRFTLVTDQRSLSFMFDNKKRTKIKNNKILQWRLELSSYDYDVQYRPGDMNVVPDTLSRAFCFMVGEKTLEEIHTGLCLPGVTRMLHYVRSKNLLNILFNIYFL